MSTSGMADSTSTPTEITNEITNLNGSRGEGFSDGKRKTLTELVGLMMKASGQVTTIAVSGDARWIVTGDGKKKVTVWDATTHQKSLEITEFQSLVWAVDISSDSARIAAASGDKTARIFSITTGGQLISPIQHDGAVVGVGFSPAGDQIATATYERDSVRIYDSYTGEKLFEIPVRIRSTGTTPLTWSPGGQYLFAVSPGKINCLDTSTSACSEWPIHNSDIQASIVSNGRFMACSAGTSVSFWDIASHEQIGRVLEHPEHVSCVALSPNAKDLACGNGTNVSVYRLSDILPNLYLSQWAHGTPLMEVSLAAVEPWMRDDAKKAEAILSGEIGKNNSNHHALANRALMRVRLRDWGAAMEDADRSLQVKTSPIGHIAKALVLVGAGKGDLGLLEFDFAFRPCDAQHNVFLLAIKSIVAFVCGKHEEAILRICGLITGSDEATKYYCAQILGNIYLKRGEYKAAIQSFQAAPVLAPPHEVPQLKTISLIFGWTFGGLERLAWRRLCEALYTSGRIKEFGETVLEMINPLLEGEKEAVSCRLLENTVTRSRDVVLLSRNGQSSTYNSCLPASPAAYANTSHAPPTLMGTEMETRLAELRTVFPPNDHDAVVIYDRVARLQPVRFANRRLLLPCLIFPVRSLSKNGGDTYHAKITWIGEVQLTTNDVLPLKEPWRLMLVHPWLRRLRGAHADITLDDSDGFDADADVDVRSNQPRGSIDIDAEIVHAPETPSAPSDTYTRALELIARLGQAFNALLLLRQRDGTYKRVASENEIVVEGRGHIVPTDIRPEVLEVL